MKKHILLIDDDKDEIEIFLEALNQIPGSFKCTYAGSAEEGIKKFKKLKPDVVFVDYNLPRINGMQFLSVVNSDMKPGRVRIYLYSTSITDEMNKMARVLGAAGCIEKTPAINTLAHELKAILNPQLLPAYVFFAREK